MVGCSHGHRFAPPVVVKREAMANEEQLSISSFTTFAQPQLLMLLIPDGSHEVLSLALQLGDRLVVSIMARGDIVLCLG